MCNFLIHYISQETGGYTLLFITKEVIFDIIYY